VWTGVEQVAWRARSCSGGSVDALDFWMEDFSGFVHVLLVCFALFIETVAF
jgi:hypothetical protein